METLWTRLWRTNRDIVYKQLATYPNEYVKNACIGGLHKACQSVEFWKQLWRVRFDRAPPEGTLEEVRKMYYETNFWHEMKSITSDVGTVAVYNHYHFYIHHSSMLIVEEEYTDEEKERHAKENKDRQEASDVYFELPSLPVSLIRDEFDKHPLLYLLVRPLAIFYNNIDVLLASIARYPIIFEIDVELFSILEPKIDRRDLVEDLLNALSDQKYIQLIRNTSLDMLIRLPRRENDCSIDLLRIHFGFNIKHNEYSFRHAIKAAYDNNCPSVLDILFEEAKRQLSPEDYEKVLTGVLTNELKENKDEFIQELVDSGADLITATANIIFAGHIANQELIEDIILQNQDLFADYYANLAKYVEEKQEYRRARRTADNSWIAGNRRTVEFYKFIMFTKKPKFKELHQLIFDKWKSKYPPNKIPIRKARDLQLTLGAR